MSLYYTTSSELTSVADAIRTASGTSASLVYPSGFISTIAGLGKCVTGTFTAALDNGSSSTGTLTIPYSGSGYPIMGIIALADPDSVSFVNYAVYMIGFVKDIPATEPTYQQTNANDNAYITCMYRKSSQTMYSGDYTRLYRPAPYRSTSSQALVCALTSKNTISYYICNLSSYGLQSNTLYRYAFVYSE